MPGVAGQFHRVRHPLLLHGLDELAAVPQPGQQPLHELQPDPAYAAALVLEGRAALRCFALA